MTCAKDSCQGLKAFLWYQGLMPVCGSWLGKQFGTSFSVVYAIIFMIWFEMPVVNDMKFHQYILLLVY